MNIVYLGNFRHPWCTEVHLARELEGLGHNVDRTQEPPGGGGRDFVDALETRLLHQPPDLLVFQRTWGLHESATEAWRNLEAVGIVTASYHLDLYLGLERETTIERDPFWTTGWVFTPDGNPEAADWFAAHGVNHHYVAPAVVSDELEPGTFRPEFDHDVVFVGSPGWDPATGGGYHPEWPHRFELVQWLAATFGERFHRYGGDTTPGPIRGRDLNDLYASARVVVGDSCFAHRGTRYWSDRPYETWGRGGNLVFPRIDALEEQVGLYPSWDVGDWDALGEMIENMLAFERAGLRSARHRLHDEVRARHTYRHRLAHVLQVMGLA